MATLNEVFKTTLFYTAPGMSVAQNVFYWALGNAAADDDDCDDAIDGWVQGDWVTDWQALASQNAELVSTLTQVINVDGTVKRTVSTHAVGEIGGVGENVNSAAVSGFFYSPTATPKVRGRKFVPGAADSLVVGGLLTSTALGYLATLADDYLDVLTVGLTGGVLVPVVVSTAVGLVRALGSTVLATDVPAYQRRRKPNVGS